MAIPRSEPAKKGDRTVYVTVGVWREGNNIHVTIPHGGGIHTNYRPGDREYDAYRQELARHGRWETQA